MFAFVGFGDTCKSNELFIHGCNNRLETFNAESDHVYVNGFLTGIVLGGDANDSRQHDYSTHRMFKYGTFVVI